MTDNGDVTESASRVNASYYVPTLYVTLGLTGLQLKWLISI